MNEKSPDKHNRIKSFKCIECQLVFPESSRFQDKSVCVTCVAEAGYKAVAEKEKSGDQVFDVMPRTTEQKAFIDNKSSASDVKKTVKAELRAIPAVAGENNVKKDLIKDMTMIQETDWLTIPSGDFLMGSPNVDEESDERLHAVTVSEFKMLKTAVSFEQFDQFCEETGREKYSDCKWGRASRPVVFVSYWDAVDYAKWISDLTGWECRLPTEAEWEYACRAGTQTPYYTGTTITTAQANYDGSSPHLMVATGISRQKTMPTATFAENPWGLFEMHGNVYEWCASEYDHSYSGSEQIDASLDRSNDVPRVLRGGSWNTRLEALRSAARIQSKPQNRSNEWGFRLVRVD